MSLFSSPFSFVAHSSPTSRGTIKNRYRANQVINFSGLRINNITPTDLDGLIEWQNKCFILIELKYYVNPEIKTGQRLALERLSDSLNKPNIIFHAIHYNRSDDDIDAEQAIISRFYHKGTWFKPKREYGLNEAIFGFLEKIENKCKSKLN